MEFWNIERKRIFDITIAVEILLFVTLTTVMFVTHEKISQLEKQINNQAQGTPTDSPTHKRERQSRKQTPEYSTNPRIAYSQKEKQLQQRTENDPYDTKARAELASFYHSQGKKYRAIEQWQKLLEREPENVQAHFALAQHYMGMKEAEEQAIEHLQEVLALSPEHEKRKNIEAWISQLEKQKRQKEKRVEVKEIAIDAKAQRKLAIRIKRLLEQNPDHPNRERLEAWLDRAQKNIAAAEEKKN